MPSALLALQEGISIEVELPPDQVQLSSNALLSQLDKSLDQLGAVSSKIVNSISESVQSFPDFVALDSMEVEYGVSFSGEGNIYITKISGGTNIKVKLIIKRLAGK